MDVKSRVQTDIKSEKKKARALRRWAKREAPLKYVASFRGVFTVYVGTVVLGALTSILISHLWKVFHHG